MRQKWFSAVWNLYENWGDVLLLKNKQIKTFRVKSNLVVNDKGSLHLVSFSVDCLVGSETAVLERTLF